MLTRAVPGALVAEIALASGVAERVGDGADEVADVEGDGAVEQAVTSRAPAKAAMDRVIPVRPCAARWRRVEERRWHRSCGAAR